MESGGEGEVAFADGNMGRVVGKRLEVALFQFSKIAADMSGVDGDVEL